MRVRNLAAVLRAVLARPDLWASSLSLTLRLIPNGWWRHGPMPPRSYLDYRGRAVYGMPLSQVPPVDFIRYLEWCKSFPGPIR
jgi:hypothetical protein